MPLVDERGRLFGKVNLIDAGVGVIVLLLIPLGYAAYALFRTPVPTITSVEHVPVTDGAGYRLRVIGNDLRPYLRVTLGTEQAAFLVESPNAAEVTAPALPPGTHDLVLYDETRELTRVPGALVVDPPVGALKVLGSFTGLDERAAQTLANAAEGGEPSPPMRVVRLESPEPDLVPLGSVPNVISRVEGLFRVNALVILQCALVDDECVVDGTRVQSGAVVTIPYAGVTLRFRVEEVYSVDEELIDVHVRFVTPSETLAELRLEAVRASSPTGDWGLTPWFVSFEEAIPGVRTIEETNVVEEVSVVRALVRVPADRTLTGWRYRGTALLVGGRLAFTTSQHAISGTIVSIRVPEQGPTTSVPSD
jgi:hypothetical protein